MLDMETFLIIKKTLLSTKKFNEKILKKLNIDEELFYQKQEEIKQEYKRKREESCERGTMIHAMFENKMYESSSFDFSQFGFADLSGEYNCENNYYKLDVEKAVYPEFLISLESRDKILRVSGQIDLLIKNGNEITIIDYKTNLKINKTSFYNSATKSNEMMKYPLNNLMDCNFNHYQLQLSLYMYLLQQINPEFKCNALRLIHIDHDGKQHQIECEYLKEDVERMLKHYKKSIKMKGEYAKLKPVVV